MGQTSNTMENIVRVVVKSKLDSKKHIHIAISLEWKISHMNINTKLRKFLRENNVETLYDFLLQKNELEILCPIKCISEFCYFSGRVKEIIAGPPYSEEVLRMIKNNFNGIRKRPTTEQRAFMNSFYFFEKLFKKTKDFYSYISQRMQYLELNPKTVYI